MLASLHFSDLCELISDIHDIKPRPACEPATRGTPRILTIFREWKSSLPQSLTSRTGVILFRLLFPDLDIRRRFRDGFECLCIPQLKRDLARFDLKETRLAPKIVKALNLGGSDAARLRTWNQHADTQFDCLGSLLAHLMSCRVTAF